MEALKSKYEEDYQKLFKKEFQLDKNIPCYFIDSYYNLEIERDNPLTGTTSLMYLNPKIQERTGSQVIGLISYLTTKNTFCDVREIKPEETERAKLENEKMLAEKKIKELTEENQRQLRRNNNPGFSFSLNFGTNGIGFSFRR